MTLEVIVTVSRGDLTVACDNALCLSADAVEVRAGFLMLMSQGSILMRKALPSAVSDACADTNKANILCVKKGMPCGALTVPCTINV